MSKNEPFNIWDYFEKLVSDDKHAKNAKCFFCSNIYSYSSTSHNLKTHLIKVHCDSLGLAEETNKSKRIKEKEILWKYFTKTDKAKRLANCNLCSKELTYNYADNLKSHLRRLHKEAYNKFCRNIPLDSTEILDDDNNTYYLEYVEEGADQQDEDEESEAESGTSQSQDVGSYFSQMSKNITRCLLCGKRFACHKFRALKNHLRDHHPKQFLGLPDALDNENQDNEYTEVVYLEDETTNRVVDSDSSQTPAKRSRKLSPAAGVPNHGPKDEIEVFATYVTFLLRTVPTKLCTKLQQNILNMILNAKLNMERTPVMKIVVENDEKSNQNQNPSPSAEELENTTQTISDSTENGIKGLV